MLRAQAVGIRANGKTAFMREHLRSRVVVPGVAASAVSQSSTPEPETAAAAAAETATAAAAEQHTSPPRHRAAAAAAAQSTAPFDGAQHAGNTEDAVEGGADNADISDNVAGSAEIIARQQAEITTSQCKIAALEAEIREASSSRSAIEQQLKRVQAHNEVPVTKIYVRHHC